MPVMRRVCFFACRDASMIAMCACFVAVAGEIFFRHKRERSIYQ